MSAVDVVSLDVEALPPAEGTRTHPLHRGDTLTVVAIGLAEGAHLADHAAGDPITILVLSGELTITAGDETLDCAGPGTWLRLDARVRHAVTAHTASSILVTLLRA